MPGARIYRPSKTAMQSGRAKDETWVLEFEPDGRKTTDPLMGWSGSDDMRSQIKMRFDSKEDAVAFAEREGYVYKVQTPHSRPVRPKNYSDNFRYGRNR